MKKIYFIFIFILSHKNSIYVQNLPMISNPDQLYHTFIENERFDSSGYVDIMYCRYREGENKETRTGRTYYIKNNKSDTVAQFVSISNGNIIGIFDQEYDYRIRAKEKAIIVHEITNEKGIVSMLQGSLYRDAFINTPYLFRLLNLPVSAELVSKGVLDTFSTLEGRFYRITMIDTLYHDPTKLTTIESGQSLQRTQILEFWQSTFDLRRFCYMFGDTSAPESAYNTYFSPYYRLPDSISFKHLSPIDSLVSEGYLLMTPSEFKEKFATPTKPLVKVGDILNDFSLVDMSGDTIHSKDWLQGLVLLDFWYMNCAPCVARMPSVEHFYKTFKEKGARVFGINSVDKDLSIVKRFMENKKLTYSSLWDPNSSLTQNLGITAFPTLILLDATSKKVLWIKKGFDPSIPKEALAEELTIHFQSISPK